MAACPKCGSTKYRYELRSAGTRSGSRYYRTGFDDNLIIPAGVKQRKSQTRHKSVGICPDCGYVEEKRNKGCLFYVLCLLAAVVLCSVLAHSTDPDPESGSVWLNSYTELTAFDYYIDGAGIVLKEYHGDETRVNIAQTYDVDGVELPVLALDGTFVLRQVRSVIVPESVTAIGHNTFNSCGVKYLYLPASLEDFTGWGYFHDVDKIYYGGSESEWADLYTGERSRLDVVQIIFNADLQSLTIN